MTKREQKYLERVLILRTILSSPANAMAASEIADRASTECDHDALEDLPPISRRGITAKLNGMSLNGMVVGVYPGDGRPMEWRVTGHGRKVAASLDERTAP